MNTRIDTIKKLYKDFWAMQAETNAAIDDKSNSQAVRDMFRSVNFAANALLTRRLLDAGITPADLPEIAHGLGMPEEADVATFTQQAISVAVSVLAMFPDEANDSGLLQPLEEIFRTLGDDVEDAFNLAYISSQRVWFAETKRRAIKRLKADAETLLKMGVAVKLTIPETDIPEDTEERAHDIIRLAFVA